MRDKEPTKEDIEKRLAEFCDSDDVEIMECLIIKLLEIPKTRPDQSSELISQRSIWRKSGLIGKDV